jgi:phenylpyruvate tautomerase PptA (4-oxalocrotonate tautomerase family)
MPLIQVRVIKDVFNKDQKRQIINKLPWSRSKARTCAA